MDTLIANFSNQLTESITIGRNAKLNDSADKISHIIVAGLGGSGIGGLLVKDLLKYELKVPLYLCNDYHLPKYAGRDSLIIMSSYSGNTEETISMFKDAMAVKSHICCITTGGAIGDLAKEHNIDCITIPGGMPPRACLGYSFIQQLFVLRHYKLIDVDFERLIDAAVVLIDNEEERIKMKAKETARQLKGKIPVIYTERNMEAVAVRFRQQLNENAKMLCWHHLIPEMNHNELVGWRKKTDQIAVIFLRSDLEYYQNHKRIELSKPVMQRYCSLLLELFAKGKTNFEQMLYLIHLGDWLSWFLAQENEMDAMEVDVINKLKEGLAKR